MEREVILETLKKVFSFALGFVKFFKKKYFKGTYYSLTLDESSLLITDNFKTFCLFHIYRFV